MAQGDARRHCARRQYGLDRGGGSPCAGTRCEARHTGGKRAELSRMGFGAARAGRGRRPLARGRVIGVACSEQSAVHAASAMPLCRGFAARGATF